MQIELNPRQKKLIETLQSADGWLSSKEIWDIHRNCLCDDERYEVDEDKCYKLINSDMDTINQHPDFDGIIISSRSSGYKIATKKEEEEWEDSFLGEILRKFKKYWGIKHKADEDGQMVLEGFGKTVLERFK